MLTVEYEFYKNTYHGDKISEAAWPASSRDAAAFLNMVTFGREIPGEYKDACQMAVCAIAEAGYGDGEEKQVASESVGKWTRTYQADARSVDAKRMDAAMLYLSNTGLLYRGV